MMTGLTVITASPFTPPAKQEPFAVNGHLGGHPFRPNWFEVKYLGDATIQERGMVSDRARKYRITLSQVENNRPVHEFQFMILVSTGETLENRVFTASGAKYGTPEFKKERFPGGSLAGRGITWMQAFITEPPATSLHQLGEWHDEFRGAVSFGRVKDGQIAARIAISIPGEHASQIQGNYYAIFSKTSTAN